MLESWRWYGPDDPVSLSDIRQAGAEGIVSALHHIPVGKVWSVDAIQTHRGLIENEGSSTASLRFVVVESVPVHESIKRGGADRDRHIEVFAETLRNIARCGIATVCYDFMPILDWSRTDLGFRYHDGSRALRFQWNACAAFDIHILERPEAARDYDEETVRRAADVFQTMNDRERAKLTTTILAGLPGTDRSYDLPAFRTAVAEYRDVSSDRLRDNLVYFQQAITPVAEEAGIRLAIHPDDPPFSILGIPRVVSTEYDLRALFEATESPANGLTLCAGSLGSRPDNDVVNITRAFAERIHFVHLRNVRREEDRTFHESNHLDGDVDMFGVVATIVEEENRRRQAGRPDSVIPMRPDHGHQMLDDLKKETRPGYSAIGRLRGLAELRGLELGVRRALHGLRRRET